MDSGTSLGPMLAPRPCLALSLLSAAPLRGPLSWGLRVSARLPVARASPKLAPRPRLRRPSATNSRARACARLQTKH
eukprot:4945202-Heterocapsa_arctica.AAC.1